MSEAAPGEYDHLLLTDDELAQAQRVWRAQIAQAAEQAGGADKIDPELLPFLIKYNLAAGASSLQEAADHMQGPRPGPFRHADPVIFSHVTREITLAIGKAMGVE